MDEHLLRKTSLEHDFFFNLQRLHHLSQISQGGEVGEKLCDIYLYTSLHTSPHISLLIPLQIPLFSYLTSHTSLPLPHLTK